MTYTMIKTGNDDTTPYTPFITIHDTEYTYSHMYNDQNNYTTIGKLNT